MRKIFISMPMNGKSEDEIREALGDAALVLPISAGVATLILDSIIPDEDVPDGVNRSLWMLGRSIQILAEADVAYFGEGWETARGCRIEHLCADEYGILIKEAQRDKSPSLPDVSYARPNAIANTYVGDNPPDVGINPSVPSDTMDSPLSHATVRYPLPDGRAIETVYPHIDMSREKEKT